MLKQGFFNNQVKNHDQIFPLKDIFLIANSPVKNGWTVAIKGFNFTDIAFKRIAKAEKSLFFN